MLFRKYSKIGSRPKFTRPPVQESGSSRNKRRVLRHAQQPCASKCTTLLRIHMLSRPARPRIPERQSKGPRIVKGWSSENNRRVLRHAQQPCASKCTTLLRTHLLIQMLSPIVKYRLKIIKYRHFEENLLEFTENFVVYIR